MTQSRTLTRLSTRRVVTALALAGAVGTAIVAPNTASMIDTIMQKADKKKAARTMTYLKYRKLVEVKQKNGNYHYRLTKKGWDVFEKIQIEKLTVPMPKRWDKRWRLVMFDIPLSHQKQRQFLLRHLRLLDFYMLQRSAWIHPFECEKQVGVLLKYLKLEQYVSFLVVDSGNFTHHATDHFKKIKLLM